MRFKNQLLATLVAGAALALPAAAQAQSVPGEGFVGVSAGYHDLGVDSDLQTTFAPLDIDDASPIFGVFAGYDVPIGTSMFAGLEGNYQFGTDAIDSEVGVSVRLGVRAPGGAKFYVRGGYQHLDLDPEEIVNIDLGGALTGIDDSDGDYLVGAGVDFPIGSKSMIRVNLDTIAFDTLRATAGVGLRF
ncbi:outer membrane protein [Qipengyuania marisflavi]|nr:outer membrane beta-barrel protein [Qipengyuania marisflavi]